MSKNVTLTARDVCETFNVGTEVAADVFRLIHVAESLAETPHFRRACQDALRLAGLEFFGQDDCVSLEVTGADVSTEYGDVVAIYAGFMGEDVATIIYDVQTGKWVIGRPVTVRESWGDYDVHPARAFCNDEGDGRAID